MTAFIAGSKEFVTAVFWWFEVRNVRNPEGIGSREAGERTTRRPPAVRPLGVWPGPGGLAPRGSAGRALHGTPTCACKGEAAPRTTPPRMVRFPPWAWPAPASAPTRATAPDATERS